jgi:serine/threonine-protein kinase
MTICTKAAFVETLESIGILDQTQLAALRPVATNNGDPRALAGQLLRQGWLTAYQANQLLTGRADNLVLGQYVLLERLGAGGMGEVYKARHQRLDRIVALKVIRKDKVKDPVVLRRFRREIQAVAQLSHPNIVLAFDADEIDGTLFLSMEYVAGLDLATRVRRGGMLRVGQACEYIRQAALGLQHAHERSLVHRDIKPSNLIVTQVQANQAEAELFDFADRPVDFGLVKILDLGLALLRAAGDEEHSEQELTSHGLFVGTPDYVAPEQAADPHHADIRSDLYSLGCTFYFLLTGLVPFPGGSSFNKLMRHGTEEPMPVERLRPDIPATVGKIVSRLLAKNPELRHQQPRDLAADLQALLNADPRLLAGDSKPDWSSQSSWNQHGVWSRIRKVTNRKAVVASGLGLLLCSAIGISVLVSSPAASSPAKPGVKYVAPAPLAYVHRPTRTETVLATLKANGVPTLEGKWHIIGPFDNSNDRGFETIYPPEKEINFEKSYPGKKGRNLRWQEFTGFQLGTAIDLRRFEDNDFTCAYLYHAFDVKEPVELPLGLGSDDTLTVWLNGEQLLAKNVRRGVKPDEDCVTLYCKPGRNELLLKICNYQGAWGVYVMPAFPPALEKAFGTSLRRTFSGKFGK